MPIYAEKRKNSFTRKKYGEALGSQPIYPRQPSDLPASASAGKRRYEGAEQNSNADTGSEPIGGEIFGCVLRYPITTEFRWCRAGGAPSLPCRSGLPTALGCLCQPVEHPIGALLRLAGINPIGSFGVKR